MDRLTFDGNFCDIAQCRELPCRYDTSCTQRQVWERLKAYEDTGLSPRACAQAAEIEAGLNESGYSMACWAELMAADKAGRVAALDTCDGCKWRGRHQKCSCCRRNRSLKDCYEEDAPCQNA